MQSMPLCHCQPINRHKEETFIKNKIRSYVQFRVINFLILRLYVNKYIFEDGVIVSERVLHFSKSARFISSIAPKLRVTKSRENGN